MSRAVYNLTLAQRFLCQSWIREINRLQSVKANFIVEGQLIPPGFLGVPAILNTDQGCHYTSLALTRVPMAHGIQISMDSVSRALDNIYVERFWRSLKYEDIHLRDYRRKKHALWY